MSQKNTNKKYCSINSSAVGGGGDGGGVYGLEKQFSENMSAPLRALPDFFPEFKSVIRSDTSSQEHA